MPVISFPNGETKQFDSAISVLDVARSISERLAQEALAGDVNGQLVDLSYLISHDATVKIITTKDPISVEIIRHSCAHLLAQAVQILFPGVQVTIGPIIENGFYYDFAYKNAFTTEDLVTIEKKMQELVDQDLLILECPQKNGHNFVKMFYNKQRGVRCQQTKELIQKTFKEMLLN
jgi:threonyl-tRNA synthetase